MASACLAVHSAAVADLGQCLAGHGVTPESVTRVVYGYRYFPANATLFIVGDLDASKGNGVQAALDSINQHFGKVAPKLDENDQLVPRMPVRPPVEHGWGIGPIRKGVFCPSGLPAAPLP